MSTGVCLQLDMGNSSAKWRLLRGADIVARGRYLPGDEASAEELLNLDTAPEQIWISSVAAVAAERELVERLLECWGVQPWFARTQARTGELVNSYEDPSRMGTDRWLAMLGARARHNGALCVVDAGSALTIDLVAASGTHEGGYIIPGPYLMERALLLDTDRVRFEEDIEYELAPGNSTAEAVRHGIALAQAGAVTMALESAGSSRQLFYCGGGGERLQTLVGRGGEFVGDLVFEGLEIAAVK